MRHIQNSVILASSFLTLVNIAYLGFLVSRQSRWRPKESRPYVCTCVRKYLRARSSNFSETWQLGRTWIGAGNVPVDF